MIYHRYALYSLIQAILPLLVPVTVYLALYNRRNALIILLLTFKNQPLNTCDLREIGSVLPGRGLLSACKVINIIKYCEVTGVTTYIRDGGFWFLQM